MRISNRLVTFSECTSAFTDALLDESQAHPSSSLNPKNTMNLINVTAKVSYLPDIIADVRRKDPAVHVSLSSDSIVKQQGN
jgi:hypothetical protein